MDIKTVNYNLGQIMFLWTNDFFENKPSVLQSNLVHMHVTWFMRY